MKKILILVVSVFVILIIGLVVLWSFRVSVTNYFLAKDFGVPVEIQGIELSKNKLTISGFEMKNPHFSHSELALSTKNIIFESSWKKLKGNPLTIDKIQADDILIVVELFNKKGNQNNWATILSHEGNNFKKGKPYLIKSLILNRIKVRLIQTNGKIKDYPAIKQLAFNNISDETGFPVDEIERAILHVIMKSIFQQLGLDSLIKTLYPPNLFKKILPFFGEIKISNSEEKVR